MFRDQLNILSSRTTNGIVLGGFGLLLLCLLGPIKLFDGSDVPISLQSLLVILLPVLFGWKIGLSAVVGYLLLGAMGLPVFVGYSSGYDKLFGPTGGFLIAFAIGALIAGVIAEMNAPALKIRALIALLAGHVIILGLGLTWLWNIVPEEEPVERLLNYFGPTTVVKIAISFLIVQIMARVIAQKEKNTA